MPQLKQLVLRKIYLPSTEKAENEEDKAFVIVKDKLRGADWVSARSGHNDVEKTILSIVAYIHDWNFTDKDGVKTPIDYESVSLLETEDFGFLAEKLLETAEASVKSLDKGEKKTSISTLTPPIPGESLT